MNAGKRKFVGYLVRGGLVLLAALGLCLSIVKFGSWWERMTASEVAAWVTGIATVLLALVAVRQSGQAKRQVEISNRNVATAEQQATSAEASVEAALEVQREAIRSRADQFAPRVVAFYEPPKPPLMDGLRNGMPGYDDLRLLHPDSFERSQGARGYEFVFPESKDTFVWFHGRALLANEGASSARVRLPSESDFIKGASWIDGTEVRVPTVIREGASISAILPPGERAMFQWAAGHTADEWAEAYRDTKGRNPNTDIWLWVTAFDSREIGVVDTLLAHFKPPTIVPVAGRQEHWHVPNTDDFGLVVPIPTRRNYRHEGNQTEDLSQMDAYYRGEEI